jgi:hypothetical protein
MKVCSKCKVEKNDSEYYTYYHSNFNKHYTRGVCQDCMKLQAKQVKLRIKEQKQLLKEERNKMIDILAQQNISQPAVAELIVEDYSNNPDYKSCTMCAEYKLLEEFYQNKQSGYYHSRCKPCHLQYSSGKLNDYYEEKYKTKGGSERVMRKAGDFVDIYQEEQTAWLLELIGWSKDGEVWVKKGIKQVVDGKIVWDKIRPKEKQIVLRKTRTVITNEDIKDIVKLRSDGLLIREITKIYKCSSTTIRRILSEAYEEAKRNG